MVHVEKVIIEANGTVLGLNNATIMVGAHSDVILRCFSLDEHNKLIKVCLSDRLPH